MCTYASAFQAWGRSRSFVENTIPTDVSQNNNRMVCNVVSARFYGAKVLEVWSSRIKKFVSLPVGLRKIRLSLPKDIMDDIPPSSFKPSLLRKLSRALEKSTKIGSGLVWDGHDGHCPKRKYFSSYHPCSLYHHLRSL